MKKIIFVLAILFLLGITASLISPYMSGGGDSSENHPPGVEGGSSSGEIEEPSQDLNGSANVEYVVLWSESPNFAGMLYEEPNNDNVPSVYYDSEDFSLGFDEVSVFYKNESVGSMYGDNVFCFNLPNQNEGIYVYSLKLTVDGVGSAFPQHMDVFLRSSGLENEIDLFDIDSGLSSLGDLEFFEKISEEGSWGYSEFLFEFEFDFDRDVVKVFLTDLNGKKMFVTDNSISSLRSYDALNTKELPVILCFKIPADTYSIGDDVSYIGFYSCTYKKQIKT